MAEYIERGALMVALCEEIVGDGDYYRGKDAMQDQIRDMVSQFPQADVAPVRHGRWINEPDGGTLCSACNQRVREVTGGRSEPVDLSNLPYCPKCGARMNR